MTAVNIPLDCTNPEEFAAKLRTAAALHPIGFMIEVNFARLVAARLDRAEMVLSEFADMRAHCAALRAEIDGARALHEKTRALSAEGHLMAGRALRRLYASMGFTAMALALLTLAVLL